ncbi:10819_t:CDS:2, partial [Scutellospora calospora]
NQEDNFSVCPVSDGAKFDKPSCINSPILVEILSESDGCRVTTSLCQTEDPKENTMMELQCYVMDVKQFDFNHIIMSEKEESEKKTMMIG